MNDQIVLAERADPPPYMDAPWNRPAKPPLVTPQVQLGKKKPEFDPHGVDPHSPGAKCDGGKVQAGLVLGGFAKALLAVAEVGTYGARKYTPDGWRMVLGGKQRYTDAMYRHLLHEASGEMRDQDTELLHAAHAAWNALARLHFILEEQNGQTKNT